MVELSMVRDVVAIMGVIVGFTYYVITVRNAQRIQQQQLETRQLQLYHAIQQDQHNMDVYLAYVEVIYSQQWADFEEFWQKYGPFTNPKAYAYFILIAEIMNEAAVLFEQKAIDPMLLYRHNGPIVLGWWEKIEPIVKELRTRQKRLVKVWISIENLVNEFKQIEKRELSAVS